MVEKKIEQLLEDIDWETIKDFFHGMGKDFGESVKHLGDQGPDTAPPQAPVVGEGVGTPPEDLPPKGVSGEKVRELFNGIKLPKK